MKERSTRCPPKLRILSALLAFSMLLTLLPVTAFAASSDKLETKGTVDYVRYEGTTIWRVAHYFGNESNLTLESQFDGQIVFFINEKVFQNKTNLTHVTLPTNLAEIENEAFAGCTNLETVVVPKTLQKVWPRAFQGCTSLKSFTMDGLSWATVDTYAFAGCTSLESFTITGPEATLNDNAFEGCTNLKEVTLPQEIKSFGDNVFAGCTKLKKIIYNGKSTEWANCPANGKIPANVQVVCVPLDEYDISVCGIKANEVNYANMLGDNKVEFVPTSNYLILNNANVSYDDATTAAIDSTLNSLVIAGRGNDVIENKNTSGPGIKTTGELVLRSSHIIVKGKPAISAQSIVVHDDDYWYRTAANGTYVKSTGTVAIGNASYFELIESQDDPNETGILLWINGKRMPKIEGEYDVFEDGTALLWEYDYGAYSGMHCTLNLKNAKLESDDTAILTRVDELTISGTGTIKGGNNSIRTKNTGTVYGAEVIIEDANLTFTGGLDLEAGASITNSTVNINGWTDYGMKAGSNLIIDGSDVTIASKTGEYALRPQIVQMYGNSTLRLQGEKSIVNGGDQRCITYTKYWYRTEPNGEYTEGTDEIFYLNPSYTYYELTTIDPAKKPDPNPTPDPNPNPNPNPDPNPNPTNYKVYWVVHPGDEPVNGGMQIPGAIFGSEEEARLFEGWFLEDGTRLEDSPYYMGPDAGYVGNLDRDVTFYGHWRTAESAEGSEGGDGFGTLLAGGAVIGAAGVVAYQVGTELILDQLLPAGVAVPHTRAELAMLLWNTAGRPAPAALPAFADVADPELANAAQWAIEQGYLKARADGSFQPDKGVAKWRVIRGYRAVTEP